MPLYELPEGWAVLAATALRHDAKTAPTWARQRMLETATRLENPVQHSASAPELHEEPE